MTERKQPANWLGPITPTNTVEEKKATPPKTGPDWKHLLSQAEHADRPLTDEELSLWKRGLIDGNARMWNAEYVDAAQAALEQRELARLLAMLDAGIPAPTFLLPVIAEVIRRQSTGSSGRPPSLTELELENIRTVYPKLMGLAPDASDKKARTDTIAYPAKIKGVSAKTIERALQKPKR